MRDVAGEPDRSPRALRLLDRLGIVPGSQVTLVARDEVSDTVVLENAAPCEQFLDIAVAVCPQAQQLVLYMQPRRVESSLGAGPGGAESIVVLVVLLTGQAGSDIGGGELEVSALQVIQHHTQGFRYLVFGGPGTRVLLPLPEESPAIIK